MRAEDFQGDKELPRHCCGLADHNSMRTLLRTFQGSNRAAIDSLSICYIMSCIGKRGGYDSGHRTG